MQIQEPRALRTCSLLAVALSATTAFAQFSSTPIGTPISGGSGSAATTPSGPRPALMPGTVVIPESSRLNAADVGKNAHTNIRFVNPGVANPLEAPPYSGYAYETPTSLACVYHMVSTVPAGCNPNTVTTVNSGGSKVIAIVDAFDDPEAAPDLAYFSAQFGLPFSVSKFQVVYASGFQPPIDYSGGWELEESLDIEMAHAMAPAATIYLVEANSNSFTDLFTAVTVATNLVQCGSSSTTIGACASVTGAGEVSLSWGSGEFSGETAYDSYFNQTNVVFLASAGDAPGTSYPAASPNVVGVGGTSISRSLSTGNQFAEPGWDDGGGGLSSFELIPTYQSAIASVKAVAGTQRATPDVSADANPTTGVWVYDSMPTNFVFYSSNWWIVGGTSVAAPLWAGILNKAATAGTGFATSSTAELTRLYNNVSSATAYAANFHDVVTAECNYYNSSRAAAGYDLCTGLGSPIGVGGK